MKNGRRCLFYSLDYSHISALQRKSGADLYEKLELKDMYEKYSKLYRESPKENWNTDWWRKAAFQALSSKTTERPPVRAKTVVKVDRYFRKKLAREALYRFRKFEISSNGDISTTNIFRVDVIITEAVDAIGSYLKLFEPKINHQSVTDTDRSLEVTEQRKEASNRGGAILQKKRQTAELDAPCCRN